MSIGFIIRPIRLEDNPQVAEVIRTVMPEFGAGGAGFAMNDAEVDDMFSNYRGARQEYFVIDRDQKIFGGAGIAPLADGDADTCELRKMYLLQEARGFGLGKTLLALCIDTAKLFNYKRCYLETLQSMQRAQQLYQSFGFKPLYKPMGNTGHYSCDCWYEKEL